MTKQKHDFTKEMKNVDLTDGAGRSAGQSRGREYWSVKVEFEPTAKAHLNRFMFHELALYNTLVATFGSRIRSFPEHILELNEVWLKVMAKMAEHQISIRNMDRAKEGSPLHPELEEFRDLLLGKDSKGVRHLTERLVMMMDAASAPGTIHPLVRKNMTLEVVRFYKEQAVIALQPGKDVEDAFRMPPTILEQCDLIRKRHLQMPRSIVKTRWNATREGTEFLTPYIAHPIFIPGINLNEDAGWNLLILHQEPGVIAGARTPWVVDIRDVPSGYAVKYLDVQNPYAGAAFFTAKKRFAS